MSKPPPRSYDVSTYRKHKRPEGWGSLCPQHLSLDAQALLDSGVLLGASVYNIDGTFAFKAFEHEPGCWHGFPIPWSRIPVAAARALIEEGRLDEATWRKALRKKWGSELDE